MSCAVDRFIEWIDKLNTSISGPGTSALAISMNVSVGDRGLIARRSFPSDSCVLSLTAHDPRVILTPRRALAVLSLCPLNKFPSLSIPQCIQPQDALTLFFYHFKICDRDCPLWSLWRPYINVLPEIFSDVAYVHTCHSKLFQSWILPSSLIAAVECQSNRMLSSFQRCFSSFDGISREAFAWAWSLVNSRCVYCKLDSDTEMKMRNFPIQIEFDSTPHFELLGPEPNMAVVPFFDFFNHSSSVSTKIELTDGVVYLTTSGSYNIGDQVNI